MRPLTFTVEKPIPATQTVPRSAKIVPFDNRGRLRHKFEPITSTHSSKLVMPSAAATEGGASGSCRPKGVIIEFARADQGGQAAKGHEYRSAESETGLTLADYAAIVYVVMSAAFYPALIYLLSS